MAQGSNYIVDAENVVHLIKQARMITECTDLLPQPEVLLPGRSVLDGGCEPGEWVMQVAKASSLLPGYGY